MTRLHDDVQELELRALGERLSSLRLCDRSALEAMRRSLEKHGQLTTIAVFPQGEELEVIDGFKRVRAARALGWRVLRASVFEGTLVEAKLRLSELHEGKGLTEIEEAWLVRSLYREDDLSLPAIARQLGRHRSWVWRRLMLVESLDPAVQSEVRLGLISARAAVEVSRLPRGNQTAASAVVVRRGLTVRQTELLIAEALETREPTARAQLLARRLDGPSPIAGPGPRPSRAVKSEADWMSADILRLGEVAARLEVRLLASPLEAFTPAAAELIRDALVRLSPVLRALDAVIERIAKGEAA